MNYKKDINPTLIGGVYRINRQDCVGLYAVVTDNQVKTDPHTHWSYVTAQLVTCRHGVFNAHSQPFEFYLREIGSHQGFIPEFTPPYRRVERDLQDLQDTCEALGKVRDWWRQCGGDTFWLGEIAQALSASIEFKQSQLDELIERDRS